MRAVAPMSGSQPPTPEPRLQPAEIQNISDLPQGLVLHVMAWSTPSARGFAMTSDPGKSLISFDILAIVSVCGLLFIAAIREVSLPWSIPAMTLFAVAGLTLLCILPFARRAAPVRRPRATSELTT
jgi:hypothetical protein